jgi:hypothetical protein
MIIEKNILFFKSASVILDDDKIPDLIKSNKYSSIVVLSYKKLDLLNFSFSTKPTLLIDLKKGEDEIFQGFNDTTRNEIRKTKSYDQLKISEKDSPDIESYRLYKEFEYSQGRVPASYEAISHAVFFGAYIGGELISGLYVSKSHPYLRVRSIFSKRLATEDRELYKQIGYATRRLIWEACLWGKKEGFVSLDMASVNINNPKTESIAKFKMSFGKDLTPEYIYIYKSPLFSFFEKLVGVRVFVKKFIFKLKNIFS